MTATLTQIMPYLIGMVLMIAGAFLLSFGCILLVRLILRIARSRGKLPGDVQDPPSDRPQ